MVPQIFEQSVTIQATATRVERCFTDRALMHRWLNPALRCDPVGEWNTDLGGQTRFVIQVPLLEPALHSTVVERQPGLVVWEFTGFFAGRDRWECQPLEDPGSIATRLLNRFEFTPSNLIVAFGFRTFAAQWTQRDMQAQLRRLKRVAEELQQLGQ
ncbi:MAG: SRPBCC family protein [Prochlorothrix sp.]